MTQPYSIISSTSALCIRVLSARAALGRSYSWRVYLRKLHHALHMRRSISINISVLWLTFPQVYELVRLVVHLGGCLYAEYAGDLRHPLGASTYYLSLGLRYGEAERRAHDHDRPHHLPGLLGQTRDSSGIVSVQHALQRLHQSWLSDGCSLPPPHPRSLSEALVFLFVFHLWLMDPNVLGHQSHLRNVYILPVITKDIPISPPFSPFDFLWSTNGGIL